jgi:hypothetical protein
MAITPARTKSSNASMIELTFVEVKRLALLSIAFSVLDGLSHSLSSTVMTSFSIVWLGVNPKRVSIKQ